MICHTCLLILWLLFLLRPQNEGFLERQKDIHTQLNKKCTVESPSASSTLISQEGPPPGHSSYSGTGNAHGDDSLLATDFISVDSPSCYSYSTSSNDVNASPSSQVGIFLNPI